MPKSEFHERDRRARPRTPEERLHVIWPADNVELLGKYLDTRRLRALEEITAVSQLPRGTECRPLHAIDLLWVQDKCLRVEQIRDWQTSKEGKDIRERWRGAFCIRKLLVC